MFRFKGKAQTLAQIIKNGAALFWASFTDVWPIALAFALLTIIPSPIKFDIHQPVLNLKIVFLAILVALILLPFKAFISGMMFHRIFLVGSGAQVKLIDSAHFVAKKIIPLSIAFILCNTIIVLGYMAFVIPGFFFSIMLIFVTPLIILDDHSIIEAFQYSWLLVWKSWWRTFAVVIIPMAMFIVGVSQYFFRSPPFYIIAIDVVRMTLVGPFLFAMILVGFYDAKLRHHLALNLNKPVEGIKHEELSKKSH